MSEGRSRGLQFVDTNILVYAHDASAGAKRQVAARLLENLWNSRRGCVSIQVLQEFFVVVTSRTHPPLPRPRAREIVAAYHAWFVHSPTVADVERAIDIHERHGISFWDAMIVASASRLDCETLWSEDLGHGQAYEGVIVKSPFAGI